MLYAPDLPFVGAYFNVIDERDSLRTDFLAHPASAPRGKLLHEKLRDLIGSARLDRVFSEVLEGAGFLVSVKAAVGDSARGEEFVRTWTGPYPKVRYRLAAWSSSPRPDLCEECVQVSVEVERQGATLAEPVQVLFRDREDRDVVVTAPATKAVLRSVTATLAAPLDVVEIDPFARLAESPTQSDLMPRLDNRSTPVWRVLLNNFNILLAATEGQVQTAVDLGFAKRYDARWRYALRADYGPGAVSLSTRGRYGFGNPVRADQLDQWIGLILGGEYLRPGFAGQQRDAFAAGAVLFYGYDSRESLWAPETGTGLRLSLAYNRLFGTLPVAETEVSRNSLSLSVRALQQCMLGLRHQLSFRLSGGAFVQGSPREQLLFAIGGRRNLRGYATDDAVGRLRGIGSIEWLHPLIPQFHEDGFFIVWVNGIDGALYADVAVIADGFDEFGDRQVLGDVGYGLRFYLDHFGVRPGVMSFDVAMPLVKTPSMSTLGPPAIYIDFTQSFLGF
jgi:hypothetical protein